MLSEEQVEELREAVRRVDFKQSMQNAKDMGIEVTTGERDYHAIYNEDGELEKLDVDKHLVMGKERDKEK